MLKTKNLRWTKDRFSNSILSARLLSVLAFIFALSMTPPEGQTSSADRSKLEGAMSGLAYRSQTRVRVSARISDLTHLSFCLHFPE
jgi:hypothetical protein